jgi:hypothetical protein
MYQTPRDLFFPLRLFLECLLDIPLLLRHTKSTWVEVSGGKVEMWCSWKISGEVHRWVWGFWVLNNHCKHPAMGPNQSKIPFLVAVPGPVVPYLESEEDITGQVPNSCPLSSNSPQQALPEPSGEAATEPKPQRNNFPVEAPEATRRDNAGSHPETTNEDWKALDTHQALARGDPGAARIPAELSRAQEVLRPAAQESGDHLFSHSDGLTRAQRYQQRTSAKDSLLAQERAESGERVGLTESDTLSQGSGEAQAGEVPRGTPEFHVSAVRGTVYTKTACDPSVLSRMGGSCSVPARSVSDATCVNYTDSPFNLHETKGCGGASYRLEGKSMPSSMPVSSVCEGSQGSDSLLVCESNKVEVKRMHGHEVVVPDYKCIPRGTCVCENDVRDERCSAVTAKSLQSNSEKHWQQGKLSAPSTSVRPACECDLRRSKGVGLFIDDEYIHMHIIQILHQFNNNNHSRQR